MLRTLALIAAQIVVLATTGCINEAPGGTFNNAGSDASVPFDAGADAGPFLDAALDAADANLAQAPIPRCMPGQNCVVVYAGTGEFGYRDGSLDRAALAEPYGMALLTSGDLLVADTANHAIRLVTSAGAETFAAGADRGPPRTDGPLDEATFDLPTDVLETPDGTIWVLECGGGGALRQITNGTVTTASLAVGCARGMALSPDGAIYIASASRHQVLRYEIGTGMLTPVAGQEGVAGHLDGAAESALLDTPSDVAIDSAGMIYIADSGNSVVRQVSTGRVNTFAGVPGTFDIAFGPVREARFNGINGVTLDDNTLYVMTNTGVSKIEPGEAPEVEPFVAPNFAFAVVEGPPLQAKLMNPTRLVVDADRLYVSSRFTGRIFAIGEFAPTTDPYAGASCTECYRPLVGSGHRGVREGTGNDAMLHGPDSVVRYRDGYAVTLRGGHQIGFVTDDGDFSIIAGDGGCTNRLEVAERGAPRDVSICAPTGLAVVEGTLYAIGRNFNDVFAITDDSVKLLMEIAPAALDRPVGLAALDGVLYTTSPAGTILVRIDLENETYSQREIGLPGVFSIAGDDAGNLYLPDVNSSCVRTLAPEAGELQAREWLGECGTPGHIDGPKASARIERPLAVTFGPDGRGWVTLQDGLVEVNGDTVTHQTNDQVRGQFYGSFDTARVNAPDSIVVSHDGASLIMSETSTDRLTQWVF